MVNALELIIASAPVVSLAIDVKTSSQFQTRHPMSLSSIAMVSPHQIQVFAQKMDNARLQMNANALMDSLETSVNKPQQKTLRPLLLTWE